VTLDTVRLRRFVNHALIGATNDSAPERALLSAAFILLSDQLGLRLRPLFGGLAIKDLLARALSLAQKEFPWLDGVSVDGSDGYALLGLEAIKEDVSPHELASGFSAILAHQIALLCGFIGDDIVLPLVEQSWGTASLVPPAHTEGEQ
jgi:hypothetical protein